MIAVIPAAGEGTRLRPHTHTLPKVLVDVAGKPILGHILDQLVAAGISRVVLIVGYLGDLVEEYVRGHFRLEAFFVEQEERKGLGHAVSLARPHVEDKPCLIIYGDTIFEVDLPSMLVGEVNLIGVKAVEDPRRFGVVETDGRRITRLVEKPEAPKSNLAIVGLNKLVDSAAMFDAIDHLMKHEIRTQGEYQLTDAFQRMIEVGARLETFPVEDWFDCGKQETLLSTNRRLLERAAAASERPGTVIVPPVYIADEAEVEESVIGPYVSIAAGCRVRRAVLSDCILSVGAVVENMVLKNSLIGARARVAGSALVYDGGDSSTVSHIE
ncbi:NTP transferase domain-containing protein [bacterium]|nr:NTP transferase domain-containing protein [bacterium]